MANSAGDKLGPYEILSPIGSGGMGDVWKARDTRLDRTVAIKTSKVEFNERFEREARAVAALNHPHICQLYDVGPNYLVMELVEGSPLKGPMPLDRTLALAIQLADAMDAAHRKGITHRDLKPPNVLVTKSGIKVLDFGLAKMERAQGVGIAEETVTQSPTREGTLLGTLQYMAPEQLQAKEVDGRADIFSFGCVLYEMLTGKRAFDGRNAASIIAAVMERPAPSVAEVAPAALDRVLKRCLEKDPDDRWQSARDLRWALENVSATGARTSPAETGTSPGRWLWRAAFAVLLLAFFSMSVVHFREAPPASPEPIRLQMPLPEDSMAAAAFALSPNGRHLAYFAEGSDRIRRLWLRSLDSLAARPLPGAQAIDTVPIFWSPDSRFVAYVTGGILKKIPIAGGPPETIIENGEIGGAWNRDGVIILGGNPGATRVGTEANTNGGLTRVAANSVATPLTVVDPHREFAHHHPAFLPDGKHFLYLKVALAPENSGIYLGDLDTPPAKQSTKRLVATTFGPAQFVPFPNSGASPSGNGYLLFMRDGTLFAQAFSDKNFEVTGDPVTVAEPVGSFVDRALFSAGANGTLVYNLSAAREYQFSWLERRGSQLFPGPTVGAVKDFSVSELDLSPEGKRVALVRRDLQRAATTNIWLLDLLKGSIGPFTYRPAMERSAVWSPDGKRIVFSSSRNGPVDLYVKDSDGSKEEELLLKSDKNKFATSWSRDGSFLLYEQTSAQQRSEIWVLSDPGEAIADHKPAPFLQTGAVEAEAQFSPETTGPPRWVAYVSNESARDEVYVRAFTPGSPATGSKWLVSRGGGNKPRWRSDGRELTYQAGGKIYSVDVSTSPVFQAGSPKPLPDLPAGRAAAEITADGSRVLVAARAKQNGPTPFIVLLNWQAGLKK
jgi:WD40 repeat protein